MPFPIATKPWPNRGKRKKMVPSEGPWFIPLSNFPYGRRDIGIHGGEGDYHFPTKGCIRVPDPCDNQLANILRHNKHGHNRITAY